MVKNTITLNKNKDTLFIAICMFKGHTFITVGIYEGYEVKKILCRVGKHAVGGVFCDFVEALFYKTPAELVDEIRYNSYGRINYLAHELSYAQYIEFIRLLETIQNENPFFIFKPTPEKGNSVILTGTRDPLFPARCSNSNMAKNLSELSVANTCRHSAIELIKKATGDTLSSLVSSNFVSKLPYQTQLVSGEVHRNIPFYVLPSSPMAYPHLTQPKKDLLIKLYQRMERVLLIAPNASLTKKKFECLKTLYLNLSGPHEDPSLVGLLSSIKKWREKHNYTVNTHRQLNIFDHMYSFFSNTPRKTATAQLMDEIENELHKASDLKVKMGTYV